MDAASAEETTAEKKKKGASAADVPVPVPVAAPALSAVPGDATRTRAVLAGGAGLLAGLLLGRHTR